MHRWAPARAQCRRSRPSSRARARRAFNSSSVRMVWYFVRSIGSFRAASARAAANEIGVPLGLAALSALSAPAFGSLALTGALPPLLTEGGELAASEASLAACCAGDDKGIAASISEGLICEYSATRLV